MFILNTNWVCVQCETKLKLSACLVLHL